MPIPTSAEIAKMTPMMQQYYRLKSESVNAIMFFRMGDFFEVFGDDAEEIAPILEIVLTSRERGDKKKIPFCGVPHHSAKSYWLKLLKRGYKITIADQVEDPALAKGLVKREIIRTLTPGCIDEIEGLQSELPNYIMAAYEDPKSRKWAVVFADISTGELRLGQVESLDEVVSKVKDFSPKELLVRRFALPIVTQKLKSLCVNFPLILDELPEAAFADSSLQESILEEILGVRDLKGFPCYKAHGGPFSGGIEVVTSLFLHLKKLKLSLSAFRTIKGLSDPETMTLGDTLIRDLELFETARRREAKGSLFYQINKTLSPMGARLTRWSISRPLLKMDAITARQDAIERLIAIGEDSLQEVRDFFRGSFDLERLTTRVLSGAAQPAELSKIRDTLYRAHKVCDFLEKKLSSDLKNKNYQHLKLCLSELSKCKDPLKLLTQALIERPENLGKGDLVFKSDFCEELSSLLSLSQNGKEKVAEYESSLRKLTGISSLKIKSHKNFGLLIEVTKTNIAKVPESFIRRQTMVNCERFVTNDLKNLDEELSSALERAIQKESELYDQLIRKLAGFAGDIYKVSDSLAQIDMLQGFAWLAMKENYCRPKLTSKKEFILKNCRHPVIEHFVGKHDFVANHIEMTDEKKHMLITGPNMAGKSTVMRQTAICAILSQAGCFVPAEAAIMPIFDQIYTRVGASDDLSKGQSTFMVEMSEAAQILKLATEDSLVILDEVGRGTSTQDGLAIASAILEHLAVEVRCWSLFATHYHELTEVSEKFDTVKNMQTEVIESAKGIEFSHRLIDGVSGSSFGLEVAKLAGVPQSVISKANLYMREELPKVQKSKKTGLSIEEVVEAEQKLATPQSKISTPPIGFKKILKRLAEIDMDSLTPRHAMNVLYEIKELSEVKENLDFFHEAFILNDVAKTH
ncbi:MAG: DNA mismatch repair protein MutS [Bdellovibrionota bacterium]